MSSILVFFQCKSNPGFAASSHEHTFLAMALNIVGCYDKVHFAYQSLEDGHSPDLPKELSNFVEFDINWDDKEKLENIKSYIKKNNIDIVFGFDQAPKKAIYKSFRDGGVKHFISYWGAPMSTLNSWPKLGLKKLEIAFSSLGPDHYIFQSEGMRRTATHGRGIARKKTSIVKTGIDTDRYKPSEKQSFYAHDKFSIERNKHIVFFSGHMEERKGVHIIVKTAVHLCEVLHRKDIHFLILGNKEGQEETFDKLYKHTKAVDHVTFGGYRQDIPDLLRSCSIGMIASTGWDSFPMSSLEMAATELPLLVSDLAGLKEAITEESGVLFPVGNVEAASEALIELIDNADLRRKMGIAGRERVMKYYSREQQVIALETIIRSVMKKNTGHSK